MSGETFGPQYHIDLAGKKYFEALGQAHWITRERQPDVHIDYEIELRDGNEPSGLTAYIQLKSQRITKTADDKGSVRVPKKHLLYYLAKTETPVFLVLVDTTEQAGWFLFMQEWLSASDVLKRGKAKDVTISVPLAQRIDDYPAFLLAVRKAREYMRELRPGSPEAALRAATKDYEQIEPRFSYALSVNEKGRHLRFIPKDGPVQLKLHVKDKDPKKIESVMSDLFGYGKKVDLTGMEMTLTGSPLFEGKKIAGFSFEPAEIKQGQVEIVCNEPGYVFALTLSCRMSAGGTGIHIETDARQSPLTLTYLLPKSQLMPGGDGQLTFSVDFSRWYGEKLLLLPWFEGTHDLLKAVSARKNLVFKFHYNGMRLASGMLNIPSETKNFADQFWLCGLLKKARYLAESGKVNPTTPDLDNITRREIDLIEMGFDLLTEGSHKYCQHPFSLTVYMEGNDVVFDAFKDGLRQQASFPVQQHGTRLDFFGVSVQIAQHLFHLENVSTSVKPEDLERAKKDRCMLPILCVSTPESCIIVRTVSQQAASAPSECGDNEKDRRCPH